jgi:hypothetical protein
MSRTLQGKEREVLEVVNKAFVGIADAKIMTLSSH